MNWTVIKEILPLLIGLGGVVVSIISVYRVSTNSFQEVLHTKQVDLCVEIISELDAFTVEFFSLLGCARGQCDKDSLGAVLLDVQTSFLTLRHKFKGYSILLPAPLTQRLLSYLAAVESVIFDPADVERGLRILHNASTPLAEAVVVRLATSASSDIMVVYAELILVARNSLGIDALSKKTYELLAK